MTTPASGKVNDYLTLPRSPGILVVDDEEGLRSLLSRGLRHHGFCVWLASDGREAVQIYQSNRDAIDLVLLDIQMPGLDGPQTLQTLRSVNPSVRCCLMSGHPGDYTNEDLAKLGVAHFISKPFGLAETAKVLRQLVETSTPRVA